MGGYTYEWSPQFGGQGFTVTVCYYFVALSLSGLMVHQLSKNTATVPPHTGCFSFGTKSSNETLPLTLDLFSLLDALFDFWDGDLWVHCDRLDCVGFQIVSLLLFMITFRVELRILLK
jgi:hypothetical protein